jgi:predicted transcriptional regulator
MRRRAKLITDSQATKLLLNVERLRVLEPFVDSEMTVKAAATALGMDENKVFKIVKQLEAHGLIAVTRLERRSGRAIRHYKASAEHFFIPYQNFAFEDYIAKSNDVFQRRLERAVLRATTTGNRLATSNGLEIFKNEDGQLSVYVARIDHGPINLEQMFSFDEPAVFSIWLEFDLEFSDAKALQRELIDLQARYARRTKKSQRYLVRLAIAPEGASDP